MIARTNEEIQLELSCNKCTKLSFGKITLRNNITFRCGDAMTMMCDHEDWKVTEKGRFNLNLNTTPVIKEANGKDR